MSETRCTCDEGHATFGACLRAKRLHVAYCQSAAGRDYTTQKQWDSELEEYRSARDQGVQPAGTKLHQTRTALDLSEKHGKAFDASDPISSFGEVVT